MRGQVQLELPEPHRLHRRSAPPPQERIGPRHQLAQLERFGDMSVVEENYCSAATSSDLTSKVSLKVSLDISRSALAQNDAVADDDAVVEQLNSSNGRL